MADKTWLGNDPGNEGDWNTAANWNPSGVPVASDNVRIPPGSNAITTGLDQSAVGLGEVVVQPGYTGTIGTNLLFLRINPNRFVFSGTGAAWIDLGASAIDASVTATGSAGTGERGLYLIGSAVNVLSVSGGFVGFASRHGEAGTVTTARVTGGSLWIGFGATVTSLEIASGDCQLSTGATSVVVDDGTLTTLETKAINTVTINQGAASLNSTGLLTTLNINGGSVNFTRSGLPRTVTTVQINAGGEVTYDPSVVTFTNTVQANTPVRLLAQPA